MYKRMPLPDHGDLMTLEEFSSRVNQGLLIDYDGHGAWATETEIFRVIDSKDYFKSMVWPSEFLKATVIPPEGATHVMWFNK